MSEIQYKIRGDEDKKLFPIIRNLASKINNDTFSVRGESIVYHEEGDADTYVYTIGSGVEDTGRTITMERSGASWFSEMRGDGVTDERVKASNKWQAMITKLSDAFYQNNPILYYDDSSTEFNQNSEIEASLQSIIRIFFGEENISMRQEVGDSTQLIYAAGLKLAMGVSVGMPRPVLGKVYFTVSADKSLEFLSREEAQKLETSLSNRAKQSEEEGGSAPKFSENISTILTTLQSMLTDREHLERNFLFNEDNREVITEMIKRYSDELKEDDIQVEISTVTVNTIFLIKVRASRYDVRFNSFTHFHAPVLSARVMFDKVTLNCSACSSHEDLIRSNVVSYKDEKGAEHRVTLVLEGTKVGLLPQNSRVVLHEGDNGYDELVAEMRENLFSKHLLKVHCEACGCRSSCYGYVCQDKQIEAYSIGVDGSKVGVKKCADCAYPESYVFLDGVPYLTSALFYDANTRRLAVDTHQTMGGKVQCPICKRPFAWHEGALEDRCNLCASLTTDDPIEVKKQKGLYAKYRGLIPVRNRFFKKTKRCVEDQSLIVFRIDNTYHVFDKLAAIIAGEDHIARTTVVYDANDEVEDYE